MLYQKIKLGYSYKIYYPLKGKNTCVAQSCVYFNDRGLCYDKMHVVKILFL